jgi:hypothetical protein
VAALLSPAPALAGPPYLTDDPQPTDTGHWEIYNFVMGVNGHEGLDGEAGLDLNYGGAKDLQLTAVLPLAFDNPSGFSTKGLEAGAGVIELAIKYKVIHQADDGWAPDVSLFPRLFIPTNRLFGGDHANLLLPVWAEKDFGPWQLFGGGGYQINPGAGQRSFWQGGAALNRTMSERLSLGAELFAQGDDSTEGGGFTTLDFGVTWKLVEHWSLLAAAGPTWETSGDHGAVFYLSLKADY